MCANHGQLDRFWAFLWRNIFRRNRQTLLGPLWFVMTPMAKMMLFTLPW